MLLLYPWYTLKSTLDLQYFRKYASEMQDLSSDVHRFDAAREIHEQLSELLGNEGKRTFFDQEPEEEVKEGA